MRYLITGGGGFLGSNLAYAIQQKKEELFVFDNLQRHGADRNIEWLKSKGPLEFLNADIRSFDDVAAAIKTVKPDVVFHVAGQVAMTTSIEDPHLDFEINTVGGHNILEAVRNHAPKAVVTYSSTNKVYGDLEQVRLEEGKTRYTCPDHPDGFDESMGLNFQSPYGCSKGATDQYMLDYARIFGLNTVVFRHSSVFGGRQFSTYDQGWVGWFVKQALDTKEGTLQEPFTISGNGKQVRDVLFIEDLVDCYFKAVDHIQSIRGEVFNIGGGARNSLSLLELFSILEEELGITMQFKKLPWRQSDQRVFIADINRARERFGWSPRTDHRTGIRKMIEWVKHSASA